MIQLKSSHEIEILRENALILCVILQDILDAAGPGVSTAELDRLAASLIEKAGAKPAFLGYRGYPAVICASINDEIVHGIPSPKRVLSDGDVFSIDIGIERRGYFADKAETIIIGGPSGEGVELLDVAHEALRRGIERANPGERVGDISHAIGEYVRSQGYAVVKRFVGHGIGRAMHEEPQIPNFGAAGRGAKLMVGMVLAIEPMIWKEVGDASNGLDEEIILDDGWTVVTPHGQIAAHVEDMILVTDSGPEVLTKVLVRAN